MIQESLSACDLDHLVKATSSSEAWMVTLIPILSVGIQGDCRSYKNAIALSSNSLTIDWHSLSVIAKVIPKICTTINRVVYAFDGKIEHPVTTVTSTFLSSSLIEMSREAHFVVDTILEEEGIVFQS
ncbi:hypothetical protein MXB_3514 [Myxobolus squamalis]|nr:hypothetical protein MXB_3514 [Myxobolus squamalis]